MLELLEFNVTEFNLTTKSDQEQTAVTDASFPSYLSAMPTVSVIYKEHYHDKRLPSPQQNVLLWFYIIIDTTSGIQVHTSHVRLCLHFQNDYVTSICI